MKKDLNFSMEFDVDSSTYKLSLVTTTENGDTKKTCQAKLETVFELSKDLKNIQKNDPGKFASMVSNNFRDVLDNKKEYIVKYSVQKSDSGETNVTVYY